MHRLITCAIALAFCASAQSADAPLVERYLHSGEYAKGEKALQLALEANPRDDQLRFGLGVLQVFAGVNHLGQGLYEYGIKSEHQNLPLVRLPVPKNRNPSPITYTAFRRLLEVLQHDLEKAEATLAKVTDDSVKLPLRLAYIRFDFRNEGKSEDKFLEVIKGMLRTDPQFLKGNSSFLVNFDRGDVAWLRAYCHLLMGLIDFYLAFDTENSFDSFADRAFAQPKRRLYGEPGDDWNRLEVKEPQRLSQFRKHLLMVCKLNVETWKHIRAETDDDHEWLPHAKQKGVLGLPVRDEMIDTWLTMMAEIEKLFEGKTVLPEMLMKFVWPTIEGGLNFKTLLEDPPTKFDFDAIQKNGPNAKYLEKNAPGCNVDALWRAIQLFNDPLNMGYMAWFN